MAARTSVTHTLMPPPTVRLQTVVGGKVFDEGEMPLDQAVAMARTRAAQTELAEGWFF